MKKWLLKNIDSVVSAKLSKETGLGSFMCDILVARGIVSAEQAQRFFNGYEISDPMLIQDMDKAVLLIQQALENGDKITVYGDYDCDGVTSTVMLFSYLQAVGGEVDWYIPTRDEGYGLNKAAIKRIADNDTKLIITVDNGISAIDEADLIYKLGMKLVITDHHQVPEELPQAEAIINPHRPDDISPCKMLAGCGVALKLIMALEQDIQGVMEQFGDLAAIGTIGDVVPLTDENRQIVSSGIENMLYSENAGLLQLLSKAGITEERLSSTSVAFSICPRINAAGRYASPKTAVELLLCDDLNQAANKAEELSMLNSQRQQTELQILEQVETMLSQNAELLNQRVIVVAGDGWNHGIIGIVSSRLLEKYGKPNLVIGIENGEARGSGRSVEGFSLYAMLDACKDCLIKFGGHVKAAGFSLDVDRIDEFRKRIYDYSKEKYPIMPALTIEADKALEQGEMTIANIQNLVHLQPFGEGNNNPLFLLKNCRIKSTKSLKEGKYTSFSADIGGKEFRCLCFGVPFNEFWYNIGTEVDLLANVDINEFNDKKSISIKVKEIRSSKFSQDKYFAAKNFYEKLLRGEKIDAKLLKRIIPEVADLKTPFDLIRKYSNLAMLEGMAMENGINYCMFRVILDIFAEFGHMDIDVVKNQVTYKKGGSRILLENSSVLQRVRECAD